MRLLPVYKHRVQGLLDSLNVMRLNRRQYLKEYSIHNTPENVADLIAADPVLKDITAETLRIRQIALPKYYEIVEDADAID